MIKKKKKIPQPNTNDKPTSAAVTAALMAEKKEKEKNLKKIYCFSWCKEEEKKKDFSNKKRM